MIQGYLGMMEGASMNAEGHFSDAAEDLPDAMPERWETAIEDLAQAVALGLDRAQDLADAVNDVLHTRPMLAKAAGAAVVGAIAGSIIASKLGRRRSPKEQIEARVEVAREKAQEVKDSAEELSSLVLDQALAIARGAAENVSRRAPSRSDLLNGATRVGESVRGRVSSKPEPDLRTVGYAAQLIPLGIALLKNPIVRDMLIRAAVKTARRGK